MTEKEIEQIERNLEFCEEVWKREMDKIARLEVDIWNKRVEWLYGTR